MIEITVATYTRNRAALLAQVLESLCRQSLPADRYEIVVVDNASTDGTRRVVEQFAAQYANLHYFFEEKLGVSAARNRGWKEARGNYVAFIDDDGKAPPNWLERASQIIDETRFVARSPDIFGGPVFPFYSSPKPAWYKDEYGIFTNGAVPRPLVENEYFHGSNLFVRREIFDQIGGFDENLGMVGNRLRYGEETAFLNKLRAQMPAASNFYDPELFAYHLVRPEKYSLAWQFHSHIQLGRQNYLAYSAGVYPLTLRHVLAFVALSGLIIYQATLGVVLRNRSVYPYPQNYYMERLFHSLSSWSRHYERLSRNLAPKVSK